MWHTPLCIAHPSIQTDRPGLLVAATIKPPNKLSRPTGYWNMYNSPAERLVSDHVRSSALASSTVVGGTKHPCMAITADDGLGVLMGSWPCTEGV